MKEQGRAFQCEPCREIIIFFVVSDASPYIAASTARVGDSCHATIGSLTAVMAVPPALQRQARRLCDAAHAAKNGACL
jgi:hypothetical protein